jgi:septal ring factor EnvC (AmiA/AmiB activator)
MTRSLVARRFVTVTGVVLATLIGFAAIRAAAAWAAASAPLVVSPIPAATLQARIADEQARSALLRDQLAALTGQTKDLMTALDEAQARIRSDTSHAADLASQLKAAKRRLATLEAAIAKAGRSAPGRASSTGSASSSNGSGHTSGGEREPEDEHEGG